MIDVPFALMRCHAVKPAASTVHETAAHTMGRNATLCCQPAGKATAKLVTSSMGKNTSSSRPSSISIDERYSHVLPVATPVTTMAAPTEYPIPFGLSEPLLG